MSHIVTLSAQLRSLSDRLYVLENVPGRMNPAMARQLRAERAEVYEDLDSMVSGVSELTSDENQALFHAAYAIWIDWSGRQIGKHATMREAQAEADRLNAERVRDNVFYSPTVNRNSGFDVGVCSSD